MHGRIYLIGFMGSGKSHTGRLLAPRMGFSFVDLDSWVEEKAGMNIPEIFRRLGEAAFRDLEAECLRDTSRIEDAIISCGGGTPCHLGNMDWMNNNGLTLFLDPSVPVLVSRLLPRRFKRPLIRDLDTYEAMEAFVGERLQARRSIYQRARIHYRPENGEIEAADALEPLLIQMLEEE